MQVYLMQKDTILAKGEVSSTRSSKPVAMNPVLQGYALQPLAEKLFSNLRSCVRWKDEGLEHAISQTGLASLTNSLWVREISAQTRTWEDVSLFRAVEDAGEAAEALVERDGELCWQKKSELPGNPMGRKHSWYERQEVQGERRLYECSIGGMKLGPGDCTQQIETDIQPIIKWMAGQVTEKLPAIQARKYEVQEICGRLYSRTQLLTTEDRGIQLEPQRDLQAYKRSDSWEVLEWLEEGGWESEQFAQRVLMIKWLLSDYGNLSTADFSKWIDSNSSKNTEQGWFPIQGFERAFEGLYSQETKAAVKAGRKLTDADRQYAERIGMPHEGIEDRLNQIKRDNKWQESLKALKHFEFTQHPVYTLDSDLMDRMNQLFRAKYRRLTK